MTIDTTVETSADKRIESSGEPASWHTRDRRRLITLDLVLISTSILVTYLLKFGQDLSTRVGDTGIPYLAAGLIIGALLTASLVTSGAYDRRILGAGLEEYRRVARSSLMVFAGIAVASYLLGAQLSRMFFLMTLPLVIVLTVVGRWLARLRLQRRRIRGEAMMRTAVVGMIDDVQSLVRDMKGRTDVGFRPIIAVVLDGCPPDDLRARLDGLEILPLEHLAGEARDGRVDAVAVTSGLSRGQTRELAWSLEDSAVELMFAPTITDVAGPRIHLTDTQGLELVHVDLPRFRGGRVIVKRAFDIAVSIVALVLTLPVLVLVALAIRLDDGGPVLYRQERVGVRGEPFTIHKFRSMRVNADQLIEDMIEQSGGRALLFKDEGDPRITRVGHFLRRYSLDELPQFWTVLRGPMSVVGPRPQVSREVAEYTPAAHRRLLVKPGITGLWQVNGRSTLSPDESIRLDLRYVENWSLLGDVLIILKTVAVVLRREGAY